MHRAVALVMTILAGAAVVCFVLMAGATSPAERAVDGAVLLLVVVAMTGLSYFVWPRGVR